MAAEAMRAIGGGLSGAMIAGDSGSRVLLPFDMVAYGGTMALFIVWVM